MAMRFMGKNLHKKVVIPMRSSAMYPRKTQKQEIKVEEKETKQNEEIVMAAPAPKTEKKNKKNKKNTEMNVNALNTIENLASAAPEHKVKVEKKEKGLYERMENTVLLTEDNKMLLND